MGSMTGPEFALSVIASMIAAVLYDMLRDPSPPGFKQDLDDLLEKGKYLLRKTIARESSTKKTLRAARPLPESEGSPLLIHRAISKKDTLARPIESPSNACPSCSYIPVCDPMRHRAFLKTLAS